MNKIILILMAFISLNSSIHCLLGKLAGGYVLYRATHPRVYYLEDEDDDDAPADNYHTRCWNQCSEAVHKKEIGLSSFSECVDTCDKRAEEIIEICKKQCHRTPGVDRFSFDSCVDKCTEEKTKQNN